jgi:4-diphosphocytidyl-2-C-methyl-D-erythritol kinase
MILIKSPAKINWSLYILNKRNDNYHNILSLMQCIDLYDELIIEPSNDISVKTDISIPQEENLIYKVAIKLQSYFNIKDGARIYLKKNIPLGAGLGGGSSNAASTLKGLSQLWRLNVKEVELKKIGAQIGSDIPFFFSCPLAIVQGKGDIVKPLQINKSQFILLVKPSFSISTTWAYNLIKIERRKSKKYLNINFFLKNINDIYESLKSGNIFKLNFLLHNDFETLIFKKYPIIADLKNRLIEKGALAALMSGSGSTIFGVFEKKDMAIKASESFSGFWYSVVNTSSIKST